MAPFHFSFHFNLPFAERYQRLMNERGKEERGIWISQGEGKHCKERKESLFICLSFGKFNSLIFLKNARNQLFANERQQGLKFAHLCVQLSSLSLGCCPRFCWVVVHCGWCSSGRSLTLSIPATAQIPLVNILWVLQNKENMYSMMSTHPLGGCWLSYRSCPSLPFISFISLLSLVFPFTKKKIKKQKKLTNVFVCGFSSSIKILVCLSTTNL